MRRSDLSSRANLLYAFCLSIIFVIIDYAAIVLLTEPLALYLPISNVTASNIVHLLIISLIATLLSCLAFGALKGREFLVPWAYCFFPAFILICFLFVRYNIEPEEKPFAYSLISLYTLIPTVVGLIISWGIYLRKYRIRPQ